MKRMLCRCKAGSAHVMFELDQAIGMFLPKRVAYTGAGCKGDVKAQLTSYSATVRGRDGSSMVESTSTKGTSSMAACTHHHRCVTLHAQGELQLSITSCLPSPKGTPFLWSLARPRAMKGPTALDLSVHLGISKWTASSHADAPC
jgi:hypothetical protein